MSIHRDRLPQLDARLFLTDGGLETTLIFEDGLDLPDFAAFPLLRTEDGRATLRRYFESYVAIALRDQVGIVLETPTWRASADWGARLGFSLDDLRAVNRAAVEQLLEIRRTHETATTPIVVSGCIGPRGDGYEVGTAMRPDDAREYHLLQAEAFTSAGADLVTAITMTHVEEAIGVTEAARAAGVPVVISFTVETDGRLPSGQGLGEAIEAVDSATDSYPAYFAINCAHPTHFRAVLEGDPPWTARLGGLRANASTLSHAELDEAEELDDGDPSDLAAHYRSLHDQLPTLRVLGGCCGTDHRHIDAISTACKRGTPA
jgi:S-methylmethionine-dependent homocysteine/selenocysteine methylase